jgi:hypothetical protein
MRIFVDGVQKTSFSYSSAINLGTALIGGYAGGTENGAFQGYISNLRVLVGTGVTTIAVPTSPLTAITNTSLLTNFTNAGIIDQTGKNNLETVGNAQLSTSVKKYNNSSIYFDGTGDWLFMPPNINNDLGTGNFTIEMWIYPTAAIQDYRMLLAKATGVNDCYISLRGGGTGGRLELVIPGAVVFQLSLNNSISLNTWSHLAIVRVGSTWTGYVNGVSLGSGTSSLPFNISETYGTYIGRYGNTPAYEWVGYIDDLRITKGVARYTSNFTPPTAIT